MEILTLVFIFIIGTVFGSFFNVVGYRMPKNISIITPGSFCPHCHHKLKWYELIPIFSYLFLNGKCLKCKQKISVMYPLVEITTGILFLVSYLVFGFTNMFLIMIIVISLLMIVIVSDINYLIIPDEVTIFCTILLFTVKLATLGIHDASLSLLSGLFLFVLMLYIMKLGNFIFKKESLGGGDVKLMFFVGVAVGPFSGMFTIFLSSVIALPISLIMYLKNKDNVIPFGPFILIALFIILLFKIDINTILTLFNK